MAEKALAKDRKTDYWWIDSRRLVFEDGYNDREDYGDIEGLAAQIRDGGIRTPLQCYKRGEQYVVRRGHRRTKALRILEKETTPIIVPVFLVAKGYSAEMAVLDLIVENDAKPFTPWEQAKVLRRLRNFGWTPEQMAEKAGKSLVYIRRLLSLADSPQKLIDLVRTKRVSATLAMDTITEGPEAVAVVIEKGEKGQLSPTNGAEEQLSFFEPPKPEKITKSDLQPNSWKIFRKWMPTVVEKEISPEKAAFFKFLKKMAEGKLTDDDFKKFFR
jgi:ParB/RepB/Spo0J family partition protein